MSSTHIAETVGVILDAVDDYKYRLDGEKIEKLLAATEGLLSTRQRAKVVSTVFYPLTVDAVRKRDARRRRRRDR